MIATDKSVAYCAKFLLISTLLIATAEVAGAQFRNPNEADTTPAGRAGGPAAGQMGSGAAFSSLPGNMDPAATWRTDLIRGIMPHLNDPAFDNAIWGVHVVDLNTGAPVFSRNAQTGMMPASNTKLYTSAAGLEILGADFRYETRLWMTGSVDNGTLRGNLVVEGSGDPTISGRFREDEDRLFVFRQWADSLKAAGITRIEGNIIGDDTIFDDVPLGRSWSWDYTTYWYAAEMGGLTFNESCVDAVIVGTRAGEPATITWEPFNTSYVEVINETITTAPGTGFRHGYERPWGGNTVFVRNQVAAGDTVRYSLSVSNTALFFVHVLRETLQQQGISVEGEVYDRRGLPMVGGYRGSGVRVATYSSPTLAEIVYILNQRSQNMFAENLLKTIGAVQVERDRAVLADSLRRFGISFEQYMSDKGVSQVGGTAHRSAQRLLPEGQRLASASDGHRAMWPIFAHAGIDTTRLELADGSGLSRVNIVSPVMTTALLAYMWNHPDNAAREAFLASLPRPGEEIGTLRTMFRRGAARDRMMAKTGTIGFARALSGYVTAADGTPMAFSIMVNHHTVSNTDANRVIEAVINTLAEFKYPE